MSAPMRSRSTSPAMPRRFRSAPKRSRSAIQAEADSAKTTIKIIRNGSRGLFWLEPMVEVATPQGRIAYGPVRRERCRRGCSRPASCRAASMRCASATPKRSPISKNQERLTFARCGITDPLSIEDYVAHGGYRGLANALKMPPADIVTAVTDSGLRGRGGAGLPDRHQVEDGAGRQADQKYIVLQRRRRRQRHLRRPHADGRRSVPADRRHDDRRASRSAPPRATSISAREYPHAFAQMGGAIEAGDDEGLSRRQRPRQRQGVRPGSAARRRRLHLRRRDLAAGKPGRQARHGARQAAAAGDRGPVRQADGRSTTCCLSPPSRRSWTRARRSIRTTAWAGRAARMPLQLAGNIKHGGLVEKAFGLTLRELIEDFGGGTASGRPMRAVQVGGPLGAYFPAEPARYADGLRGAGGAKGHARPWRHRRVRRHRRHGAAGALRDGVLRHRILRQVHALPHRLDPRRRGRSTGSSPARSATRTSSAGRPV